MKNLVRSSNCFQFYTCSESKTLTLVFSSLMHRPPKFTFYKMFQTIETNLVMLNCSPASWYRDGIPGLGDMESTLAEIIRFKKECRAERLITVGVSMGAYGAYLYGSLLHADEVLCFGLEPLIGVPGGRNEIARNYLYPHYTDLTELKYQPKLYDIFGMMDMADNLGASILYSKVHAELFCVNEATHNVSEVIFKHNLLSELLEHFVQTGGVLCSDAVYPHAFFKNRAIIDLLWKINRPLFEKDYRTARKLCEANLNTVEEYQLLRFLYAKSCIRSGDTDKGLELFKQFKEINSSYYETYIYLASFTLKKGVNKLSPEEITLVKQYLEKALMLRTGASAVHDIISKYYELIGDFKKAAEFKLNVMKIHTNENFDKYLSQYTELCQKAEINPEPVSLQDLKEHKSSNLKQIVAQYGADYHV